MEEGTFVAIFEYNLPRATEQLFEDCLGNANVEETPHFLDSDTETHVYSMICPRAHIC